MLLCWLTFVNLIQTGHLERNNIEELPPLGRPVDIAVGHFLINEWYAKAQPTVGGSELYLKASWASNGEQASKQYSSMISASDPTSRFLSWYPALIFLHDGLWCANVSQIHPFLLQIDLFSDLSRQAGHFSWSLCLLMCNKCVLLTGWFLQSLLRHSL